ncbi:uncharacterized protein LOC127719436 [Mytilus californianus]|uniref:uncharacterized protein LOC127719436 n=1 Tax=Mytilus californianus TaxID=6549 RepID=UPI002248594C|nr:uncharacterized protein LOC127719436 [Mytilus californianus]
MEKYLVLLSFAALIASVFGCCWPSEFEGFSGSSLKADNSPAISGFYAIAVSKTKKKIYSSGKVFANGKQYSVTTLFDYTKGKKYLVVDNRCFTSAISSSMTGCLNPKAKFTVSSHYGIASSPKLSVKIYSWSDALDYKTAIVVDIGSGQCVLQAISGFSTSALSNTGYIGLKRGVSNPAVFNIPAPCPKTEGYMNEEPDHLKFVPHHNWL